MKMLGILIAMLLIFAAVIFKQEQDKKTWDKVRSVLYIHLASDGRIFVVKGDTGEELWINYDQLKVELDKVKAMKGELLYSRESPDEGQPPQVVEEAFNLIASYDLPIKFVEPHKRAL